MSTGAGRGCRIAAPPWPSPCASAMDATRALALGGPTAQGHHLDPRHPRRRRATGRPSLPPRHPKSTRVGAPGVARCHSQRHTGALPVAAASLPTVVTLWAISRGRWWAIGTPVRLHLIGPPSGQAKRSCWRVRGVLQRPGMEDLVIAEIQDGRSRRPGRSGAQRPDVDRWSGLLNDHRHPGRMGGVLEPR